MLYFRLFLLKNSFTALRQGGMLQGKPAGGVRMGKHGAALAASAAAFWTQPISAAIHSLLTSSRQ